MSRQPYIKEYATSLALAERCMPSEANLTFIKTAYGGLDFVCGGGSVVFRAVQPDGEMVAVKCYRDVSQRRCEVYRALQHLDTGGYVTPTRFHAGGLTLLWEGGAERVDVAVTPWLEGLTLDRKVAELRAAGDEQGLRQLLDELESMAVWLLAQPWAHGDLKPENIIVREDGSMVAIDWDAAFVPMFKGMRAVEIGTAAEVYAHPAHPYTQGLLGAVPVADPDFEKAKAYEAMSGEVTSPVNCKPGCRFAARCEYCTGRCSESNPEFVEVTPGHYVSCFLVNDK